MVAFRGRLRGRLIAAAPGGRSAEKSPGPGPRSPVRELLRLGLARLGLGNFLSQPRKLKIAENNQKSIGLGRNYQQTA